MLRIGLKWLLAAIALLVLWQLCLSYTISDLQVVQERRQSVQLSDLDRQLTQFSFIPKLLSEDIEIRRAVVTGDTQSVLDANRRLARTQQDSGLDVAFLLDKAGLTIASSNWSDSISFVGISYSFRPYFRNAVKGRGATFFAVGATSGIPGYFIAEPVLSDEQVVGVVVAKVSLNVLAASWSQLLYESLIVDEFGGVILSTREDLLYTPTAPLEPFQVAQLNQERRYQLGKPIIDLVTKQPAKRVIVDGETSDTYFLFRQRLETEPWQLFSLVDERQIKQQAFNLAATVASLCFIVFLLIRLYQQQRRLVVSEQRTSQELEEKVSSRTRELEMAQQRLISESNFAMLGRMSGAINHEINQPLASLRLNLASLRTMIEKDDADQQEIEQIVIDSDRTTKRIARVISSLRSLARKNESRFERFDVVRVTQEVYTTVQRERAAVSQYLTLSEPSIKGLSVLGDEVLIQQALLNLLYNAFDAVLKTDSPSVVLSVEVSAMPGRVGDEGNALTQHHVVISVKDNGPGICASVAATLFEPFATTREHTDGLGLGLTIARQIASDHGGELLYTAQHSGSCFSLQLPLLDPLRT